MHPVARPAQSNGGIAIPRQILDELSIVRPSARRHPAVRRVAEALLGPGIKPARRTRGVYAIFPSAARRQVLPSLNMVCCVVALRDEAPRGGRCFVS